MDDALLSEVYERESRPLVGMLWVFTGDKAVAEDLAQEAFVRLALAWHRVREPAKAGAYSARLPSISLDRTTAER